MNLEEGEISGEEMEKVLFVRRESESNDEDDNDDAWDDSMLIKEYDRAMAKAKRKVIKKLQSEMGMSNTDIENVFSDSSIKIKDTKKKNKKKRSKCIWSVGSACRAVYSEDGLEYEAEILELVEPDSCVVKFVGYENQERVLLSDLKPSCGKEAVDMQILSANFDEITSHDKSAGSADEENKRFIREYFPQPINSCDVNPPGQSDVFQRPPMELHSLPPPPPPPPPPTTRLNKSSIADQDFESMLMSWYMCGYYTGYYQRALNDS